MENETETELKNKSKEEKKKKKERADKYVFVVSSIYILVLLIMSVALINWVASVDVKNAFLKSGVATLITLIFGTSSKSLYTFFLHAPYNFDKSEFEKNKENKILEYMGSIFADLISGLALLFYVAKISGIPNRFNISIICIVFILVTISFIITINATPKATQKNGNEKNNVWFNNLLSVFISLNN